MTATWSGVMTQMVEHLLANWRPQVQTSVPPNEKKKMPATRWYERGKWLIGVHVVLKVWSREHAGFLSPWWGWGEIYITYHENMLFMLIYNGIVIITFKWTNRLICKYVKNIGTSKGVVDKYNQLSLFWFQVKENPSLT
jgi:hypothetical protein